MITTIIKSAFALQEMNRLNRLVFSTIVLCWVILFLILYPGIYSSDFFSTIQSASNYTTSYWFSNLFGFFVMSSRNMSSDYSAITVFSLFLLFSGCLRLLQLKPIKETWQCVLFVVVCFYPLAQQFLFYVYRDVYFSLFSALMIVVASEIYFSTKNKYFLFFELFTYMLICGLLREDGKAYVLATLLFLFIFFFNYKKIWIVQSVFFIGILFLISHGWSRTEVELDKKYRLTAFYSQLNSIFAKTKKAISENDTQNINKIFDVEYLKSNLDEILITGFHTGHFNSNYTNNDWKNFVLSYVNIVNDNFKIFLENRINIFLISLNIKPGALICADELNKFAEFSKSRGGRPELSELQNSTLFKKMRRFYLGVNYMAQDLSKEYSSIRLLFQSPFILILIFIGLLFLSSNKAFYLGLFGIIVSRNLIVFLTAPEPQFKYYGTFIFPVVFLIYLVAVETSYFKISRREKNV